MQAPAQMGYDRAITVFSPDGRLFQVEYAREAVKRGTTAVGIRAIDGVALLVDKRVTTKLLEPESIEKIFQIDDHIGAATSGLVADARVLIDHARVEAQINRITYDEPIGIEELAKKICDFKYAYTQSGGVRPFGTALLIAGVDDSRARLFETDPSGALLEYKATAIGSGRDETMEVFEKKYADNIKLEDAVLLGLEALHGISEGLFNAATIEIGVIEFSTRKFRVLAPAEVETYVDKVTKMQASEGKGKEKKKGK
jgi:proteasome alpha subunit